MNRLNKRRGRLISLDTQTDDDTRNSKCVPGTALLGQPRSPRFSVAVMRHFAGGAVSLPRTQDKKQTTWERERAGDQLPGPHRLVALVWFSCRVRRSRCWRSSLTSVRCESCSTGLVVSMQHCARADVRFPRAWPFDPVSPTGLFLARSARGIIGSNRFSCGAASACLSVLA